MWNLHLKPSLLIKPNQISPLCFFCKLGNGTPAPVVSPAAAGLRVSSRVRFVCLLTSSHCADFDELWCLIPTAWDAVSGKQWPTYMQRSSIFLWINMFVEGKKGELALLQRVSFCGLKRSAVEALISLGSPPQWCLREFCSAFVSCAVVAVAIFRCLPPYAFSGLVVK